MEVILHIAPQIAFVVLLLWMANRTRSVPGLYWLFGFILLSYGATLIQQVTMVLSGQDRVNVQAVTYTMSILSKSCFVYFIYGIYTAQAYGQDDSKKLFSFRGRLPRSCFWIINLTVLSSVWGCVQSVVSYHQNQSLLLLTKGGNFNFSTIDNKIQILVHFIDILSILSLAYIGYASTIKRLHDIGKSGAFCLLSPIPIIGQLLMIFLGLKSGAQGENEYGNPLNKNHPDGSKNELDYQSNKIFHERRALVRSKFAMVALFANICFLTFLIYLCNDSRVDPFWTAIVWLPIFVINCSAFFTSRSSGFIHSYLNRKSLESQRVAMEEKQKIKELEKMMDHN